MKIYVHNKQLNTHKLLSTLWKTKTYSVAYLIRSHKLIRLLRNMLVGEHERQQE